MSENTASSTCFLKGVVELRAATASCGPDLYFVVCAYGGGKRANLKSHPVVGPMPGRAQRRYVR